MPAASATSPERYSLLVALGTATVMIAHQVAGKATRDALFLTYFDVQALPRALVVAAVLSLLAVLVMSRLLERVAPNRLVSACFAASGLLFIAEWALFDLQPRVAAAMLYLHMAVFGAILISGFWSVLSERFDPHTAKKRVAQVTAATALGGLLGAVLAERLGSFLGLESTLLALAAMHALCAAGVVRMGVVTSAHAPAAAAEVTPGLRTLAQMPYLRAMGALVMITAVTAALLDYTLKATAQAHYREAELIRFFAGYYALTGILSFLLQTTLGPRVLQRYGIGLTLAVLPMFTLVGGVVTAVAHQLVAVVGLRGGQAVLVNSLNRSASELLYTPLTPQQKRPTKTIVDVAAERAGDMLGGGMVLLVLWLLPESHGPVLVALAALAAGAALWFVKRLHYGYVEQLARGLRRGVVTVDTEKVVDATTQNILAETSVYAEREQLLTRISEMREARQKGRRDDTLPGRVAGAEEDWQPVASAPFLPTGRREESAAARLARALHDLCAEDPATLRRALAGDFMDVRLVPCLIPLLGRDEVAADARMELRWLVPRIIGQLTDALLDPDLSLRARQRLPSVLEVCHNPRAVEALVLGLGDDEFSVRFSAARALSRMRVRDEGLRVPADAVYTAVRREVELAPADWRARRLTGDTNLDEAADASTNRTLEHVFTLFSLVHEPDSLRLCMQALSGGDRHLRGTALEYLENVLPDDVRRGLWVHLGERDSAAPRRVRPRGEVVRELQESAGKLSRRVGGG